MRPMWLVISLGLWGVIFAGISYAQAAQCVCTTGCKIASDPYPPGTGQPTSCAVYKAGLQIGTSPTVASTTIPTSNASVCAPASATYNPGVAGSVACQVTIPGQPAGNVTITMRAANAAGETADSAAFTFQSVAALPTLPQVPVNPRVN
jgi:hypothetical protein